MMSDCEHIRSSLTAWIDGDLDAAARDEVRRHVEDCAACAGLAEDLRQIRDRARILGPVPPPDHVWLEVAGQVHLDGTATPPPGAVQSGHVRQALSWIGLAAALVIVTLGIWVMQRPAAPPAQVASGTPADVVAEELDLAVAHYERAIATLEEMASAGDLPVDPAITATLRDNLGVVDQAIDESRTALDGDPASVAARDSLFDALRQKVGLLQATVTLMNEIRQGEPEAAAPSPGRGRS